MNKSNLSILIIILFILISSSIVKAQEEPKYQTNLIKRIYSIGTASVNGTYYPLGNSISRILGNELKNRVFIAEPTAGSIANVGYLRNKQIDLALMQSDVAWMAYNGSFIYASNPFKELRVIASLYSEKIQIVVRADSGINSLSDLKGKKIAVGEKQSGSAAGAIQILAKAGLKAETDYELIYERFTKSTESLFDGYIDAVYYVGAVPADGITRLANRIPIKLIEIPKTVVSSLTKEFPYYCAETIEAEAYKGQLKRISTLGFKALLACHGNLPSDEVMAMLQILYANPRIYSEQNELLIEIKKDEALMGVDSSMLHEGADIFFNPNNKQNR